VAQNRSIASSSHSASIAFRARPAFIASGVFSDRISHRTSKYRHRGKIRTCHTVFQKKYENKTGYATKKLYSHPFLVDGGIFSLNDKLNFDSSNWRPFFPGCLNKLAVSMPELIYHRRTHE
jgi:hypothetical protein